jgi:ribosomal protein S18 acetylase RimI-like enzyme
MGLGVTTSNGRAIRFYERLGFVDSGRRYPLRAGTDLQIRIMTRRLGRHGATRQAASGRHGPDTMAG